MVVSYVFKRNRRTLRKALDERVRAMLQLCADDLTSAGYAGKVRVVFQTGKSRVQARFYGLCDFFRPTPTIYIYTRYQRLHSILDTIAHEFGHVAHFVLYPKSRTHWTKAYREMFAEVYAKLMLQRLNGVTA